MSDVKINHNVYEDSGENKLLDFFTKNPCADEETVRKRWMENRHE